MTTRSRLSRPFHEPSAAARSCEETGLTRASLRAVALASGIIVLLLGSPASAQEGDERGRPDRPSRPDREEILRRFDADGDGQLDGAEREELREFFRQRGGPPFGGPGRGARGPGPGARRTLLVEKFDWDGNGRLDAQERERARGYLETKGNAGRGRRRGPGGPRLGGPFGRDSGAPEDSREPERISPGAVETYPDRPLFDTGVLRTFFLEFASDDWEEEMEAFYRTDVEVPATLTVDGKTYESVGVRFRGNSSFFGVAPGRKRPLNISLDHAHPGQRLQGYKTLNLLNAHDDPSFLRQVLHSLLASRYIPVPRTNLVKLVINGESWGIYVNEQQFNKDFLADWFDTRAGVRWKVPAGPGTRGLGYNGDDLANYMGGYQLKTGGAGEEAWKRLVELCRTLEATPSGELEAALSPILDIDRALWFVAVDNVFMDGDGYGSRASDFTMWEDPGRRFHLLPYDSNETFGIEGGGPGRRGRGRGGPPGGGFGRDLPFPSFPPRDGASDEATRREGNEAGVDRPRVAPEAERGPGRRDRPLANRPPREPIEEEPDGPSGSRFTLDPLEDADAEERPVIRKLLSVPHLRARYLAHVRTLVDESLDWRVVGPAASMLRSMLGDEIARDVKKLYSLESYEKSLDENVPVGRIQVPGLKVFFEERKAFLASHPELTKPRASIEEVMWDAPADGRGEAGPLAGAAVTIRARVGGTVSPASVILYWTGERWGPYASSAMVDDGAHGDGEAGDGVYAAEIGGLPAGTRVRYYVEARSPADVGTTVFFPNRSEMAPLHYRVQAPRREGFAVRIADVLQGAEDGPRDPQGDADDRIRLHNTSDEEIDLSGMYLSDDANEPRKWRFPEGSAIVPGGYVVIWADDDTGDRPGLHASFKLGRSGETVLLVDRDDSGNAVLATRSP